MGPDPSEIDRIVGEIRAAASGAGDVAPPAPDGGGDDPEPVSIVGLAIDQPIVTKPGLLAPVRRSVKRLVRKAIRWQLVGIAAETERIERAREWERAETQVTVSDLRREIAALRDRLGRLERSDRRQSAAATTAPGAPAEPAVAPPDAVPAVFDYFAFEALMRGSTEEIADRQQSYRTHLADVDDIVDVGCGRGELLTLLAQDGKHVRGVDLNEDMVAACVESGLDVCLSDGTSFLGALPAASVGGVVALQVVEHLTPQQLVAFLDASRHALRNDGLLVLETINPASLSALRNYFADLTHRQPLVPETLAFLVESAGFRDVRIEFRSPLADAARLRHVPFGDRAADGVQATSDRNVDLLNAALFGPQDFCVIARG